ncbi:MAG: hypothetical protein ACRCVX_09025 [Shewanella sp.]
MFYGLVNKQHATAYANAVCDVLGHGNNQCAAALLVETAATETLLGEYRDPTERAAGTGITQIDEPTFDWLKGKFASGKDADALKATFNITLSRVNYLELELSPLLAFIFCRLRYRVVTDIIPATRQGRAQYWKDHYNSSAGKGTPEEYLKRCSDCGL